MMTYLFYYKEKGFDTYRFYAFTDDKKLAQEFQNQRDMKKFRYVKEKMPKEDFLILESKYGKLKLTEGHFYTRDPNNFGKRKPIKVLCTFYEEETVIKKQDDILKELAPFLFDTRAFKDEYLKALGILVYLQFYGFFKIKYIENADSWYQPYYNSYGPVEGLIIEETHNRFEYDDLNIFLKFFGNTFNIDKEGSKQ